MNKKVYVIINSDYFVSHWQYKCINKLKNYNLVFLLAKEIKNKKYKPKRVKYFKNFFYYIINLVSIQQKKVKVNLSAYKEASIKEINFTRKSNSWEEITSESIDQIISGSPFFIYKCGMGLLHVNEKLKKIPIISHHHGDPSKFRGRPSGFYEILKGEKKIGQIVQVISNDLDAGKILSYGETKVYPWSYKKTLKDCFSISPIIFEKALINLEMGIFLNKDCNGINYKLPSNLLSINFIFKEILKLINKLFYGLFWEKFWQVGFIENFSLMRIKESQDLFKFIYSLSNNHKSLKICNGYSFFADPFVLDSNIIVEGLNNISGKGDLLLIDVKKNKIIQKLNLKNKHLSYPYTKLISDILYIYPDSGSLNKPIFYKGKNISCLEKLPLKKFLQGLVDPSVIESEGLFYLFANYTNEQYVLRLWVSKNPNFDDAFEHPHSPICISPEGGRSGGRVFKFKNKFYRFGQNCCNGYGNGLILFEIDKLDESTFSEFRISSIKFKDNFKGPHNIDFSNNLLTWDYYEDKFNFFAGVRRILNKI